MQEIDAASEEYWATQLHALGASVRISQVRFEQELNDAGARSSRVLARIACDFDAQKISVDFFSRSSLAVTLVPQLRAV
jgi:hypothetical protein